MRTSTSPFQWGHNPTVMDTVRRNTDGYAQDRNVSMGPQPNGHGYYCVSCRNDGVEDVSMGPQPNGHGYMGAYEEHVAGPRRRFQWGHNPTVMDTRVIYAEINKISTKFQWGHNPTVMDTRTSRTSWSCTSSFNGATTQRSWIQHMNA